MDTTAADVASQALDVNQAADVFAAMFAPAEDRPSVTAVAAVQEAEPVAEMAAEPAEVEDDPIVTVKLDGKDVEVKLSELKNGYQAAKVSTQRFEEASHTKRQAEAEATKARDERQATAANLQRLQAQIEGGLQEQQKIDWNALIESDPVEYLKQQHLAQTRQAQLGQVYAERQRLATIQQAEDAAASSNHLRAQSQALLGKLPEWADEGKAKAEKSAIREYLLTQGYESSDTENISDARAVVLARKAMLYDQMMSKAKAEAKRVSTLPTKVERPGVGDNPGIDRRSTAYQKLAKSGRVEDAAAVFASLLQ